MGNRAVISFQDEFYKKEDSPSIYLHWQGGRDSIEAFLDASKRLGIRGDDSTYCMARLTQIISNWLGGGQTGIGIGCYSNLDTDNGDNGTYWIKNFEIVDREFIYQEITDQERYNHEEFVQEILDANEPIFGKVKDA